MINNLAQRLLVLVVVIILVPLFVSCAGTPSTLSVSDISTDILCKCDCELVLSTCDCEDAGEMNSLIAKKLKQGQSKEQVLEYLFEQYGQRVQLPSSNS